MNSPVDGIDFWVRNSKFAWKITFFYCTLVDVLFINIIVNWMESGRFEAIKSWFICVNATAHNMFTYNIQNANVTPLLGIQQNPNINRKDQNKNINETVCIWINLENMNQIHGNKIDFIYLPFNTDVICKVLHRIQKIRSWPNASIFKHTMLLSGEANRNRINGNHRHHFNNNILNNEHYTHTHTQIAPTLVLYHSGCNYMNHKCHVTVCIFWATVCVSRKLINLCWKINPSIA